MPISGISSLGNRALAKTIANHGHDAILHELARGLADQQFLFGEQRVDEKVIDAGETRHRPIVVGLGAHFGGTETLCQMPDHAGRQRDQRPKPTPDAAHRDADQAERKQ